MEDVAKYANRLVVMNKGAIAYNDTPHNVFRHYKELEQIGLAAPQVTYVMNELKKRGLSVNTSATTVEEAKNEILHALKHSL
jgi:energy-coupling factor transport system ATP-binding protein